MKAAPFQTGIGRHKMWLPITWPTLQTHQKTPPFIANRRSVYHQFVIRTERRSDALRQYLSDNGVATGIHYPQILPDIKMFGSENRTNLFPVATQIADMGVSLPIFPELTVPQMVKVVKLVNAFDGT